MTQLVCETRMMARAQGLGQNRQGASVGMSSATTSMRASLETSILDKLNKFCAKYPIPVRRKAHESAGLGHIRSVEPDGLGKLLQLNIDVHNGGKEPKLAPRKSRMASDCYIEHAPGPLMAQGPASNYFQVKAGLKKGENSWRVLEAFVQGKWAELQDIFVVRFKRGFREPTLDQLRQFAATVDTWTGAVVPYPSPSPIPARADPTSSRPATAKRKAPATPVSSRRPKRNAPAAPGRMSVRPATPVFSRRPNPNVPAYPSRMPVRPATPVPVTVPAPASQQDFLAQMIRSCQQSVDQLSERTERTERIEERIEERMEQLERSNQQILEQVREQGQVQSTLLQQLWGSVQSILKIVKTRVHPIRLFSSSPAP